MAEQNILHLYFHAKEELMKLPGNIEYHGWMHTKTFFDAVCYIAELEKAGSKDLILLKAAALYHDRGYAEKSDDHEERSAGIARRELPAFGFSEIDINKIVQLILSTKVPTKPKNNLEMIMCDADLEAIGRDYFPYVSELLRKEQGRDEKEWTDMQISFLKKHRYYTKSARMLFDRQKKANLMQLLKSQK